MNKLLIIALFCISFSGFSQDIYGKWKTIDPDSGQAKSIVEIYNRNGKVFGKIIDLLNREDKDVVCDKCEGDNKNKPVIGFELIQDMEKDGKYYRNGTIFDPQEGKEYKCRLKLTDNINKLQVRGYIAFFYVTHYWERIID